MSEFLLVVIGKEPGITVAHTGFNLHFTNVLPSSSQWTLART